MNDFELLIDLNKNLERQGPGGVHETEKALDLIGYDKDRPLKIADLGCGTGGQTFTLSRHLNGHITAVDLFPEFLDILDAKSKTHRLEGRLKTVACSMDDLPFKENDFDLIWSEGAIYNIGFGKGVKAWHRFLKPGAYLAVSEISWTTGSRPAELEAYWMNEYAEMDTVSNKLSVIESSGFSPTAHFVLPESCWLDNYYIPLQNSYQEFLSRNNNNQAANDLVKEYKKEIEFYIKYKRYYSYGFYIAQKL